MSTYYTDREYGARPPSIDTIDERLWAGLYTLIQTRIGDGSFGLRFPEQCPDGNGPCGCDEQAFRRVLAAEVPWIEWPLSATESTSASFVTKETAFPSTVASRSWSVVSSSIFTIILRPLAARSLFHQKTRQTGRQQAAGPQSTFSFQPPERLRH